MALKLAVIASGNGSNLQAILDRISDGALQAEVCLVLSNRPGAYALERARAAGVPALALDHTTYADRESFDHAMVAALQQAGAELIVLAGYMRLLTPVFLAAFPGRVVNIHPALLPSFPGVRGAQDAQHWGVKITGCTVHFVDEEMDHGAVIAQVAVPALPGEPLEDLAARIHAMEHRIYPQVLQWIASGRVHMNGRDVHVHPATVAAAPVDGAWLAHPPLEQGF